MAQDLELHGLDLVLDPRDSKTRDALQTPSSLALILPALNEQEAIGEVIRRIPSEQLRTMGVELRTIVVDGGSSDATRQIAEGLGARVLVQPGRGKGDAVRHGMSQSETNMILVMDADGSYAPEGIIAFVGLMRDGAEVVVGSRMLGRIDRAAMPWVNYIGNRLLSLLATALYGTKITDVCSGMWGLTSQALAKMRFESSGFDIEAELVGQACRQTLRFREVPILYVPRLGQTKLTSPVPQGVRDAIRLVTVRFRRLTTG